MNLANFWFQRRSPILPPFPSWRLALGSIQNLPEPAAWNDDHLAIFADANAFALSPNQQFLVVGEAWLCNLETIPGVSQDGKNPNFLGLIAQLWEKYGTQTWEKLTGSFAIAVWDRQQQTLWLGRDRAGAKTLYYTPTGSTQWVAPQLRALNLYHARELDLVALRDYLCCAFVPGDRTLWQAVHEVRPGTAMELRSGKTHSYWQLQEHIQETDQSLEGHGDALRILLHQVIQDYLPENQPVGVFLSGGLDSSSITALAAKYHSSPIHTYSIHFGADSPNELEFSSLVAEHCQTQHHILEISLREMWQQLPEAIAALDDPIGDPLTVPNLLLGRLAKESVDVVLNGEGGDPCFGGPKNQPMLMNGLYSAIRGSSSANSLEAYLLAFQKCAADLPTLLQPAVWQAVQFQPWAFSADLESSASYLNRLMLLNIKFKGADQILTKVNNLTRAAGIDGRSPLFDQRIVDFSMTIPPEHKLSGVQEKAVLKQAVIDLLPAAIIHRPKSGMMVPVQLGFRHHWNRQAKCLLLHRRAKIAPYLNQAFIRDWLNYQGDTWGRYGVKLWLLASLEYWLQVNDANG